MLTFFQKPVFCDFEFVIGRNVHLLEIRNSDADNTHVCKTNHATVSVMGRFINHVSMLLMK
jgi:hypothetical protein